MLLRKIRDKYPNVRDIDLREAVWILIGRGTITMTPTRGLTLSERVDSTPVVKQA